MPIERSIVTREELFDLVWKSPLRDVARQFHLAPASLKRVCVRGSSSCREVERKVQNVLVRSTVPLASGRHRVLAKAENRPCRFSDANENSVIDALIRIRPKK